MPATTHALALREAAVFLAGPATNVIMAAAAILIAQQHPGPLTWPLWIVSAIASYGGLTTAFPWHFDPRRRRTDGELLRQLLHHHAHANNWAALWALQGYASMGYRPRDIPAAIVRSAASVRESTPDAAIASLLAYYWALDSGDIDAAGVYLDRLVALADSLSTHMQPGVSAERAYFLARYRGDPAAAIALCAAIPPGCPRVVVLRAWAAIHLAQGRPQEAILCAEEGMQILATDYKTQQVEDERDWLRAIIAEETTREGQALQASKG